MDLLNGVTLLNFLFIFFPLFIPLLFVKTKTKNRKLNLPPSPPKLPIIGNLHQLGMLPHRSLGSLSKKHGPIMLMHLGQTPFLVISSANIVNEMTKHHDIAFSDRPKTTAAKILLYQGEDVTFSPYGSYWRRLRKTCVVELLSVKKVHSFQYARDHELEASVDTIRRACSRGDTVNLTDILLVASNNIVSRCVLGQAFDNVGEKKFGELSRKLAKQLGSVSVSNFLPSLGWLDVVTGLVSRLKETFNQFDTLFDRVIDEHKGLMNKDKPEKDFVDILLQLQKDNLLDFDLTQDPFKALLVDMFVGGTETTASMVEWTIAELLKNPTKLKKVQEEIRKVVGKKAKIEESDINQMTYLKCVVKEALRLHPPLPLLIPRETSTGVKLGGYDIPPKITVFINAWAIQRDPEHWERPEEFLPERFDKINTIDFKGQDFQYTPFGVGRRGCPGMSFGIAAGECIIANILYWFDWELPNGMTHESLDLSESCGFTVQKKTSLVLVPKIYCP